MEKSIGRKAQVWVASLTPAREVRILLFQMQPDRGGFWQPITGGVDEGESVIAGAVRELREESGFSASDESLIDLDHAYEFEGRWGHVRESVFLYVLTREERPQLDPHEHRAAEWVSSEEALRRITFTEQHRALEKLLRVLR